MTTSKENKIIKMAVELLDKKLMEEPMSVTAPSDAIQYLRLHLENQKRECFMVLYLNNQHCLIHGECIFMGTINEVSVYPREVARLALEYNAAAVIFAHNHPSGLAEPSSADRDITHTLQVALQLFDIRVLDHLVIGKGQYVSFSERGWL